MSLIAVVLLGALFPALPFPGVGLLAPALTAEGGAFAQAPRTAAPPKTTGGAAAQARPPVRKPAAPPPAATKTEPAEFQCPSLLGEGVQTKRSFCDVLTGQTAAEGIMIALPPHSGDVTLTFDLHNRHTYSEELVKTNRAYRQYTATIGVLTADNTLISRAVVQNDFRAATDLVDRIVGGAGPGGVKAVAPTGSEAIRITIPAAEQTVSILGEKLSVIRPDGAAPDNFSAPGRPIAVISNVVLEYRPGPVRRTPTPAAKRTPAPAPKRP